MFNRFTKESRAVVVAAEAEAALMHASEVGPEHLLLALGVALLSDLGIDAETLRHDIVSSDGLDADALATLGIDLDEVRRQAEETFGEGALGWAGGGGRPRFGREVKKTLELTLREAIALGDRSLRPQHILLALTWDDHTMGLVARQGVHRDALRAAIVAGAHGP